MNILPTDSKQRKQYPMFSGLIKYFPDALAAVSNNSFKGNEKHNAGQELFWNKPLSNDHEDCIVRHLTDSLDPNLDKTEELTCLAWRALALLQTHFDELREEPISLPSDKADNHVDPKQEVQSFQSAILKHKEKIIEADILEMKRRQSYLINNITKLNNPLNLMRDKVNIVNTAGGVSVVDK